MRTLLIATALLAAFAAHAEPKRAAKEPVKPAAAKEADLQQFQPKAIEAKTIELATPELEIKTKDVNDSALERKLAKRQAKAQSTESNVMREPVQLKLDDPTAAPAAASDASKP